MAKKNLLRVAFAVMLVAALAFYGCGPAPPPKPTKSPIKIGAMFALTGPAAFIGTPTKLVAQMVVDKINGEGGINGHPLELITYDTGGDPTKALMAVKKLVDGDKVIAMIGPTRTGTGMAVKKYLEEKKIPTVMTVGGDPVIMGGKFGSFDYIFKAPQRSSIAVKKVYMYLKAQGITKVALITAEDGFGKDGARWLNRFAPEFGLTVVAKESFGPRDADMTTQLTKIRGTDAQAIVCWTIGPAGSIVSKNVKQLGINLPLFQCHGLPDPKYIELAGAASEGNLMPATKLMTADQLPDTDPQKKVILEFIDLYNNKYKYNKEFPINTHSGYAWDAIYMVANAMKKQGTDADKLRAGIEATKGYVGVSGVYNVTPEDHNGLDTDSMVILKIENGKWKMVM
jgi:branched-chain amino acid transport system substrate-binding protein